ncbi:MAG: hypothetical protein OJF48_003165 [Afipia sp.]|nr:MAG: hypothetical protein OJF48_003165 [Afipia sp.]
MLSLFGWPRCLFPARDRHASFALINRCSAVSFLACGFLCGAALRPLSSHEKGRSSTAVQAYLRYATGPVSGRCRVPTLSHPRFQICGV